MVRFSVIVVWPSVLGLYNHLNSLRGTETQNGMCMLGKELNLYYGVDNLGMYHKLLKIHILTKLFVIFRCVF